MSQYSFVGMTCLNEGQKARVRELAAVQLSPETINAYYAEMEEFLKEKYSDVHQEFNFTWRVTGRTFRRRGIFRYSGHRGGDGSIAWNLYILIHADGQTASCVIHELAHLVTVLEGHLNESHGPNFARNFQALWEHADGFLY